MPAKTPDVSKYSARVLRNRGIPTDLYETEQGPNGLWRAVPGDDDEASDLADPKSGRRIERVYIRFDFNVIAAIEETFGGIDDWQKAMAEKPASSVRTTLALALGRPLEQIGVAIAPGDVQHYGGVIGIAWALANGVDPFVGEKMLGDLEKAEAEAREQQKKLLSESENESNEKETEAPADKPPATPKGSGTS